MQFRHNKWVHTHVPVAASVVGGWQGSLYLSASNLIDKPIPEEEEEEERTEEKEGKKEGEGSEWAVWWIVLSTEHISAVNASRTTPSMKSQSYIIDEPVLPSLAPPRSSGGSFRRARAKSVPATQYLLSQQMPKLPTTEKEVQKETTAATMEPENVCF